MRWCHEERLKYYMNELFGVEYNNQKSTAFDIKISSALPTLHLPSFPA